jgi:hypothetical protein
MGRLSAHKAGWSTHGVERYSSFLPTVCSLCDKFYTVAVRSDLWYFRTVRGRGLDGSRHTDLRVIFLEVPNVGGLPPPKVLKNITNHMSSA